MTAAVLVASGLGKDFAGQRALDALSFTITSGEIVGLLGPNGAGKTTTMKLVLGMLRPSRGRVGLYAADGRLLDCTEQSAEVKAHLGYSPDEPAFYDFLSGRETLDFVLNVRGESRDVAWRRLAEDCRALDVEHELDRATGGYSLGTKKKLALLLAMAHRPRLLLLDEPTNGLDPPTAARVRELLRRRADEGAAVVVSTHLLDMADALSDRMLVLHRGRLIAEGDRARVRELAGVSPQATLESAFFALCETAGE